MIQPHKLPIRPTLQLLRPPPPPPPPPPSSLRHLSTTLPRRTSDISTPGFQPRPPSSSSTSSSTATRLPVGPLFITLTLFGISITAFGIYQYYSTFSTWPAPLRDPLRAALKCQIRGDARNAEAFYRKALDLARQLQRQSHDAPGAGAGTGLGRGSDVLKVSGIAVALASLLEDEARGYDAFCVYREAWEEVVQLGRFDPVQRARAEAEGGKVRGRARRARRTEEERMRAVAIAQRMGDLAQLDEVRAAIAAEEKDSQGSDPSSSTATRAELTGTAESLDPAERYLVWSVEELLRLAIPADVRQKALDAASPSDKPSAATPSSPLTTNAPAPPPTPSKEDQLLMADLHLPPWVTSHDLGASIEALGAFYAARGKANYAVPLYLQALALLVPPSSSSSSSSPPPRPPPTVADRCQAAVLMNNLSQLFVSTGLSASSSPASTPPNLDQAKAWALKGAELADITIRKAGFDAPPPVESSIRTVEHTSEDRTRVVRMQCLRVQITLLFNLAVMAEMTNEVCEARRLYQRAYRQAQVAEIEEARVRCAQALARLERRAVK